MSRDNPRLPANMYERYDRISGRSYKPESGRQHRRRMLADEYYRQTEPEQFANRCPLCGEFTIYIDVPGRETKWRCPSCGEEGQTAQHSFKPIHIPPPPPLRRRPGHPSYPGGAWEKTFYYIWDPYRARILGLTRSGKVARFIHGAAFSAHASRQRYYETLEEAREQLWKLAVQLPMWQPLEIHLDGKVVERYRMEPE